MRAAKRRDYTKGLPYEGEFSKCKKDELTQCWFYEFAREIPEYCQGIKDWRAQGKSFNGPFAAKLMQLSILGAHFPNMRQWPGTPYTEIPKSDRRNYLKPLPLRSRLYPIAFDFFKAVERQQTKTAARLLKELNDSGGYLNPNLLTELTTLLGNIEENPARLMSVLEKGSEIRGWPIVQLGNSAATVLMSIPWSMSATELGDAFVDFVNKNRPVAARERRGRGTQDLFFEDLKALDAHRQCRNANSPFENQTVFTTKPSWKKAMARVKAVLHAFPWRRPWVINSGVARSLISKEFR
jgi:hypothetical protein